MRYDVASKVIVDLAKEEILSVFLGMEVESVELITALPEETPSLRRSDYALWVRTSDGEERIVLLEFQTYWKTDVVWQLLDYYARTRQKYRVRVLPVVLVFNKHNVKEEYDDGVVRFRYQVTRLWEMEARDILRQGLVKVYPFVPVMDCSREEVFQAEDEIYRSPELDQPQKSDLLTALAIFAGMKDKSIAEELVKRRRDIMIESATYDIIKKEGITEGVSQGLQQGLQQGLLQGRLTEKAEDILSVISLRTGGVPSWMEQKIRSIQDKSVLDGLLKMAVTAPDRKTVEAHLMGKIASVS